MSAKTVSAPGLLGDLGGYPSEWLLDGHLQALLVTVVFGTWLLGLLNRSV